MTISEIFEALGGPAELGRAIGITTEHAASMRRRESIPVAYWQRVVSHAKQKKIRNITYETLAIAHGDRNQTHC